MFKMPNRKVLKYHNRCTVSGCWNTAKYKAERGNCLILICEEHRPDFKGLSDLF
jgi:hypothetical protein